MLDYAANVVAHWPAGELRRRFEERCETAGIDAGLALGDLADTDDDVAVDAFWAQADANMVARRIRLVFVADVIPSELVRIIEFLNENLVRTEVIGVEVRQFVGQGHQTLVPRVVGKTAAADEVREGGPARSTQRWTLDAFQAAAGSVGGIAVQRLVAAALAWLARHGGEPGFGSGRFGPMYLVLQAPSGDLVRFGNIATNGVMMVNFDSLVAHAPFDAPEARMELRERLNAIPGFNVTEHHALEARWPSVRPEALATDSALESLYAALDWAAARIAAGA